MVPLRRVQKAATTTPRTARTLITLRLLRTHRLSASARRRHHPVTMGPLLTAPLRRRRLRLPVPGLRHLRELSPHHRLLSTVVHHLLRMPLTHLLPAVSLTDLRHQAPGLRRLPLATLKDPLMVLLTATRRVLAPCTDTME